jgi:hypothetical protein
MRNNRVRFWSNEVAVQQDVDVDGPGGVGDGAGAPQGVLDTLSQIEKLLRRKRRSEAGDLVQVVGLIRRAADRRGFVNRGADNDLYAGGALQFSQGSLEVTATIAEAGTEPEIDL